MEREATFDFLGERLNLGLSQDAIAERIGISRRVWARAESGQGVQPEHARKIAEFFGRQVTELWPPEGDRVPA